MIEQEMNPELQFDNLPDILTVHQVRAILGVGRPAIYSMLHSGQLRHFKFGNAYKILKCSVLEYIANNSKGGKQA